MASFPLRWAALILGRPEHVGKPYGVTTRDYGNRTVTEVIYADPFEITKMINWRPGSVPGGMEGVARLMKYIYPANQKTP